MDQGFDFTSYNNIKRLTEEELIALWEDYFRDKTQKAVRDKLIVQYIYLMKLLALENFQLLQIRLILLIP